MSGLDDELLGLVDDDSGSEAPASEKAGSPPPRSPGELSDDDKEMGRKGTARRIPKRKRGPRYVEQGEEGGELYVLVILLHSFSLYFASSFAVSGKTPVIR